MHLSFVSTASTEPGNSGHTDLSLCKAQVYAQYCGVIFMVKALLKSWQVKFVKLLFHAGLGMESKTLWFHGTAGWCWGQNMALKLHYVPAIPATIGAGL